MQNENKELRVNRQKGGEKRDGGREKDKEKRRMIKRQGGRKEKKERGLQKRGDKF